MSDYKLYEKHEDGDTAFKIAIVFKDKTEDKRNVDEVRILDNGWVETYLDSIETGPAEVIPKDSIETIIRYG